MVPLPLATLAGITPPPHEVEIWDETVDGEIEASELLGEAFDIVGITGYTVHLSRAREIGRFFRNRGVTVVAGGPGVSAASEPMEDSFDVRFLGEAERTWPIFLEEYEAGNHGAEYGGDERADLGDAVAPRWGRLAGKLGDSYLMGAVQVSRGCPFKCEFCNVWKDFGNKMRVKPIELVLAEVRDMYELGMERILFCSDNFVGDKPYAKRLLRELVPLNRSFERPMTYAAELTLTIALDEELMELLAASGFASLLIGVESPSLAALKETNKKHNMFGDVVTSCRTVASFGLAIEGSMIVGFDSDTSEIFEQQFEFLQAACIPHPRMHMMKGIPGTDLWARLAGEGRLVDLDGFYDERMSNSGYYANEFTSNVIPLGMSREELFRGYLDLLERINSWPAFEERAMGYVKLAAERVNEREAAHPTPASPPGPEAKARWQNFLNELEPDARASVGRILEHTMALAPSMVGQVAVFCVRQYVASLNLPSLRGTLTAQAEYESIYEVEEFAIHSTPQPSASAQGAATTTRIELLRQL